MIEVPKNVNEGKLFLEAYASALADILEKLSIRDCHCKSYDPLTVDLKNKIAHSYSFDLKDGGRHHNYDNLKQLREDLLNETVDAIKEEIQLQQIK